MKTVRLTGDSMKLFLPFVYFLPKGIFENCPTLSRLSRQIRKDLYEDWATEITESDQFILELCDAVSYIAFPHFGFRGWKEDYSGFFPVWKLSYFLPLWREALELETGWTLQHLMFVPGNAPFPYKDDEYIRETMKKVVKRVIREQGWTDMLQVIREMPCDEDFEKRMTNVRKDFLRKWYHTRSKRVKCISYERFLRTDEGKLYMLTPDLNTNVESDVVYETYFGQFKSTLDEKGMEILQMRYDGYTFKEIADKLGYKNHSGVIKRMGRIKEAFIKFENMQ